MRETEDSAVTIELSRVGQPGMQAGLCGGQQMQSPCGKAGSTMLNTQGWTHVQFDGTHDGRVWWQVADTVRSRALGILGSAS